MTILPVLFRELLQQSRQAGTFWLRLLGAGLLVGLTALIWITGDLRVNQGDRVFSVFHVALCLAIWGVVPLMVADCLSQERREGTLGLLFLTPLRPIQIVAAKGIAHALRGLTFLAACLPVVVITVLMGGVDWRQMMMSITFMAASFCWALGAGLWASSQCKSMQRSLGASLACGVVGFCAMAVILGWAMIHHTPMGEWILWNRGEMIDRWEVSLRLGFTWFFEPELAWNQPGTRALGRAVPGGQAIWMWEVGALLLGTSLIGLLAAVLLAARSIRKRWQEEPPSAAQQRFHHTFCTPRVGRGFYRWWLQRKLRRNPIGWLDQRTWQARVIMWTWLAVLVSIYSSVLASGVSFVREFDVWQRGLSLLLLLTMAGTSAASFHRERESGVLELLLVSPLSVGSVLWGRLRGLWAQFMPSFVLVVVVWLYMNAAVGDFVLRRGSVPFETLRCATFALAYFCVPVIGLYFSLRLKHFLSAFAWTLVAALLVPITFGFVGVAVTPEIHLPTYRGEVGDRSVYALVTMIIPSLVLAGIAGTMLLGLKKILATRQFLG